MIIRIRNSLSDDSLPPRQPAHYSRKEHVFVVESAERANGSVLRRAPQMGLTGLLYLLVAAITQWL
jgi:hypothetical protein